MHTLFRLRPHKATLFSSLQSTSVNTMAEEFVDVKVLKECKEIIPELSALKHKGQAGRIGIFGGSNDFTGAPYYSGMSALRTGSDLIYIFCATAAAQPIKSYSPELMVTPFFDTELTSDAIQWVQNMHCAVIGPGLGKLPSTMKRVCEIIPHLRAKTIPLIFDADGITFVTLNPSVVKTYPEKVYLTPNFNEFRILCNTFLGETEFEKYAIKTLGEMLSKDLGANVTVLLKFESDLIFNSGKLVFKNEVKGSLRRCGGQGDILSGCLAAFVVWAKQNKSRSREDSSILAGIAASIITRVCNRLAFSDYGRGMTASDMIHKIPSAFKMLFDDL